MFSPLRQLLAAGFVLLLLSTPVGAQDEMVANPYYKFWAGSKPGTAAVHVEQTKLAGPEGKLVTDGVDEKRIAYKLIEVNDDRAVVEMVVTEKDFLGFVQAAPTRYIYPAKVKKSHLERILQESGAKGGDDSLKVGGTEMKCKTVTGNVKGANGEVVEYKLWLCDDAPGTIVKQVRTTKQKGELIAETTILLQPGK